MELATGRSLTDFWIFFSKVFCFSLFLTIGEHQDNLSMLKTARRYFTATPEKGSLLDFFKRGSNPTQVVKQHSKKSTGQLIEKIEQNQGELLTSSKSTYIPILGNHNAPDRVGEVELNGFKIHRWIPRQSIYSKKLATGTRFETVIDDTLSSTYNHVTGRSAHDSVELDDIQERFRLIKKVQIDFGLIISDIEFTRSHTLGQLRNLLLHKLDPSLKLIDEKLPEAIYVNSNSYIATNVSVGEFLGSRQKQVKFNELLKRVKKVERGLK